MTSSSSSDRTWTRPLHDALLLQEHQCLARGGARHAVAGGELELCRQPGPGQARADVVADHGGKLRVQRVRVVVAEARVKDITGQKQGRRTREIKVAAAPMSWFSAYA
jgi:hypothetical protein